MSANRLDKRMHGIQDENGEFYATQCEHIKKFSIRWPETNVFFSFCSFKIVIFLIICSSLETTRKLIWKGSDRVKLATYGCLNGHSWLRFWILFFFSLQVAFEEFQTINIFRMLTNEHFCFGKGVKWLINFSIYA